MNPTLVFLAVLLTGCATVSPQALRDDVDRLVLDRTGAVAPEPGESRSSALERLLAAKPLTADAAVRIALLNNPGLEASLAALSISEAERAQAGRLPNPHLALSRLRQGQTVEIERMLSFNVINLVTLPW